MAVLPNQPRSTAAALVPNPNINFGDPSKVSKVAGGASQGLLGQGAGLADEATSALAPLLKQLQKLISGDEGATNEAIQPQARAIIENYNTARRSLAEFAPRGGGSASASAESRFKEAGDISSLRSQVRTSAISELSQVAGQELSAGTALEETGLSGLVNLVQEAIQSKGQNAGLWGKIGAGVGGLIGFMVAGPVGAAAGAKLGGKL